MARIGLSTIVAVLAGGTVASAGDPPCKMADLVRMSECQLDALYRASAPTPIPCGFVPGRAIKSPGSPFTPLNARLTRLAWQGKVFRNDGTMVNRVFGGVQAIPADVSFGESWIDGKPSLILDYSRSTLWPDVRDEVREVSPGLHLGVMFDGKTVKKQKMYFSLDARK